MNMPGAWTVPSLRWLIVLVAYQALVWHTLWKRAGPEFCVRMMYWKTIFYKKGLIRNYCERRRVYTIACPLEYVTTMFELESLLVIFNFLKLNFENNVILCKKEKKINCPIGAICSLAVILVNQSYAELIGWNFMLFNK